MQRQGSFSQAEYASKCLITLGLCLDPRKDTPNPSTNPGCLPVPNAIGPVAVTNYAAAVIAPAMPALFGVSLAQQRRSEQTAAAAG
jgi:hypothetical protein